MKRSLGSQEAAFFSYVQMRGQQVVRAGEIANVLGLSAVQERELFRRLARGKLIARVRRGLYLAPLRLPPGGAWTPDSILALSTLMDDRDARYQICGPNAFNRYGFDDQVPNRTYVYNDKLSGNRTIGSVQLTLIKVDRSRLGSTEEIRNREGIVCPVSSRVRTLLDAVYDWSRFNGLPRAYEWIETELCKRRRITTSNLVEIAVAYGDKGTLRRIGVLLERTGAEERLLLRLEERLTRTSAFIPWIPTRRKRGWTSKRWGVVVNDGSTRESFSGSRRSIGVS